MPEKKVFVRYIGTEKVEGLEHGLVPGYRYEATREEEAGLFAKYGEEAIVRLEPSELELPILAVGDEVAKKPRRKPKAKE